MDASSADPLVILDKMETIFRLRWNSLIEKRRSLEASIKEVNAENEHLKIKLALSRERVAKIENERDTLARIVKEIHQELLSIPFHKIIGQLDQEVKTNINDHGLMTGFHPKINERNENLCSSTVSTIEYTDEQNTSFRNNETSKDKSISNNQIVGSSCSPLINLACISPMRVVEQTWPLDSSKSPNSVSYASCAKYFNQGTSLSDAKEEKNSSDIELCLSDSDDYEPPVVKKELVISLPKISFKNALVEDVDISTESPQNCVVCNEIFTAEEDLNKHMKKIHPNQFYEIKKLAVDFCEKPKILPRLRSLDRMKTGGEKRQNIKDDIETNNFKKLKQLSLFVSENTQSDDITSTE